jgi:hypothetical protein
MDLGLGHGSIVVSVSRCMRNELPAAGCYDRCRWCIQRTGLC